MTFTVKPEQPRPAALLELVQQLVAAHNKAEAITEEARDAHAEGDREDERTLMSWMAHYNEECNRLASAIRWLDPEFPFMRVSAWLKAHAAAVVVEATGAVAQAEEAPEWTSVLV